jgi:C4-dicarboxylate-specific signal transduction histidine kinase
MAVLISAITEVMHQNWIRLSVAELRVAQAEQLRKGNARVAGERVKIVKAMAASIAHELNQPLAATGLLLESATYLVDMEPDQRPVNLKKTLGKAKAEVIRAGRILAHLRQFIAHGEPNMKKTNLHDLIREAVELKAAKAAEREIDVRLELNATNDEVFADTVQIVQVLVNLLRNADEAIGDRVKRLIVISTISNENHVQVDIADTGCGLSPEVAAGLFEPFVTTKPGGMGVGLIISRMIIEAHDGTMSGLSNAKGGATFCFTLPILGRSVRE